MEWEQKERCGSNSALDYGSRPPRDNSFNHSTQQIMDCGLSSPQPVDNLTLKFPIGESRQYLDGLQVAFRARLEVRNADNTKVVGDHFFAPIAGMAGCLIDKLTVWTGGRPWKVYNWFAYMYHVLNILHRPAQWFKTLGQCNGFWPDRKTVQKDAAWGFNSGLKYRRAWCQKSNTMEVVDLLLCPVWLQER